MMTAAPLPIDDVLNEIRAAMLPGARLVLAAPPGAGKTTRVPLALAGLDGWPAVISGKILMLEPRRIAARLAAERMAAMIGEKLGNTIGLSTRVERRVSAATRIEVITDGLFTRRILSDPELKGIGAVLFDEFHERRLNADLGLALALETQRALNEPLRLLIMSATLDTARVSAVIGAPVIESAGRAFDVTTLYLGKSAAPVEERMAHAIRKALREEAGSVLAFLPGAREIQRTAERLSDLPRDIILAPLFGALTPAEQDAAVSPAPEGKRKIVLATDLAESSLTIDGVRIVIDAGLARVAQDDANGFGQTLSTVKAARANVDQRRGRAGRTGPGVCYRLWDAEETRGLTAAPVPEILVSDLSGLVLALAEWGERDASALTWLDAPPPGRLNAARDLLASLGALSVDGGLTPLGQEIARLPLPPRLGALIARQTNPNERALAAEIAALLGERGLGGASVDIAERLSAFRRDRSPRARALLTQAKHWGGPAEPKGDAAKLMARAWPAQIAKKRAGSDLVYLLASGRAGTLQTGDALAKSDWLVVAELGGRAKEGRILSAMALSETEALAAFPPVHDDRATFDSKTGKFAARRVKAMGAIILSEAPLPKPSSDAAAKAMLEAITEEGFAAIGADGVIAETHKRLDILRAAGLVEMDVPSTEDCREAAPVWLGPLLKRKGAHVPEPQETRETLIASFEWPVQEALKREAPLSIDLPSGQSARVDYLDPRAPLVSARAQAFYGVAEHLKIAKARVPVTVELLSPGMKPAATTQDLPRFWREGYKDMAKDMRAQYPKHDWPEDPASARAHQGLTKKRLK